MSGRFPVRRSLVLARAVWASAILACALPIQQATAQAPPPAVVACMNEHDPTQRLACYDREVPRAVAATRPPGSTPASAAAPAAQSTAAEVDAFGMTTQIQRQQTGASAPPRLDKLTARITAVSLKPRGEFIVTLDNGQVWEEAETTSHLPLRAGDDITIKRGMLGAFYMSSQQVLGLRVKRVR